MENYLIMEVDLEIRKAGAGDFDKIWDFYGEMIQLMKDSPFDPGWDREYYPDETYLSEAINSGEAYIMTDGERVISCMVVNHYLEGDFDDSVWKVQCSWDEVLAMHTFGVHPEYHHRGVSGMMMDFIISYAKEMGYRAMRLDVIPGNVPAERLYKKYGFYYVGTFTETWDDGSEEVFDVYEREI